MPKKYTGPTHMGGTSRSTAPVNPSQKSPGISTTKGHPMASPKGAGANVVSSRAPMNYHAGKGKGKSRMKSY